MALGSKRAASIRDASLAHSSRLGAATALVRAIVTRRVAFEHSSVKRAVPVASMKRALLPPGTV